MNYKGCVVEESLTDPKVINHLKVTKVEISDDDPPWHVYTVNAERGEIEFLAGYLKPGWYMHFWHGKNLVVVFRGRVFIFRSDDKRVRKMVIEYGKSLGIPEAQLDFVTD